MSKSAPDQNSRILLTDPSDRIKAKIRGAVTDSTVGITYDPEGRPGAANLLTILAACTGENVEEAFERATRDILEKVRRGVFDDDRVSAVSA